MRSRWLRRFLAAGLILHGLAHAGAGMWLTDHALAVERTRHVVLGALLWAWVTTRFVHAGFAMLRKARVAARLAVGAALLSLALLALSWSAALWFGVLVDAVVLLTVALTAPARALLLPVRRDRAPRRALRYAALAATAATTLLWPWYSHWGSRPSELRAPLPGDEAMRMQPGDVVLQHAVTIHAPPERVWSWLAQAEQGHAWLERVLGLRARDVEAVDPARPAFREGDLIRLAPDGSLGTRDLGWKVRRVEERRLLAVGYWVSFVLLPAGDGSTRLIVRTPLGDPRDHPSRAALGLLWEPIHSVVERKVLLGIKAHAERPGGKPWPLEERHDVERRAPS